MIHDAQDASAGARAREPAEFVGLPRSSVVDAAQSPLAAERTAEEAMADLALAFSEVGDAYERVAESVIWVVNATNPAVSDEDELVPSGWGIYWASNNLVREINMRLTRLFPHLGVELINDMSAPAGLAVVRKPARSAPDVGSITNLYNPDAFRQLSSGERAWLDIGLAQATAQLERVPTTAQWVSRAAGALTPDERLNLAVELADAGIDDATLDSSWSVFDRAVTMVLSLIKPLADMYTAGPGRVRVPSRQPGDGGRRAGVRSRRADSARRALVRRTRTTPPPARPTRAAEALDDDDAWIAAATHSHALLGPP